MNNHLYLIMFSLCDYVATKSKHPKTNIFLAKLSLDVITKL